VRILSFKHTKAARRYLAISAFLTVLLFIALPAVFGQDTGSIDTLRQMGKAFAGIAEKASPAVVSIKAEKTITQDYPSVPGGLAGVLLNPGRIRSRPRAPALLSLPMVISSQATILSVRPTKLLSSWQNNRKLRQRSSVQTPNLMLPS